MKKFKEETMRVKDVVMSREEMIKVHDGEICEDDFRLCLAQADFAFKAGIREVVEWLEKQGSPFNYPSPKSKVGKEPEYLLVKYREWKAKLKEWGLEG